MTCARVLFIDEKNERCHAKGANAFRAGSHRRREEGCRGGRFRRGESRTRRGDSSARAWKEPARGRALTFAPRKDGERACVSAPEKRHTKRQRFSSRGNEASMLHEFITTYRDAIIARTREKLTDWPWPLVSTTELEHGVPLFLSQLSETLRWETTPTPFSQNTIGASAAKHGRELRALGFNISQVVHDYGDIFKPSRGRRRTARSDHDRRISHAESLPRHRDRGSRDGTRAHHRRFEFNGRNRAIRTTRSRNSRHPQHRAPRVPRVETGNRCCERHTGTVLGRSLMSLHDLVDNTLSDVPMAANIQRSERVPVAAFLSEIAVVANLHAESRALRFALEHVDPQIAVNADPQLLRPP